MDGFITLISQRINWFYGFFFLYTNFIQIIEMIGKIYRFWLNKKEK